MFFLGIKLIYVRMSNCLPLSFILQHKYQGTTTEDTYKWDVESRAPPDIVDQQSQHVEPDVLSRIRETLLPLTMEFEINRREETEDERVDCVQFEPIESIQTNMLHKVLHL